ncbi:hypothetical protein HK101_011922 [Irineochytrium annulatum]|nr:hypothetical protein HK101_011922 [Irineochytrium annulatum]
MTAPTEVDDCAVCLQTLDLAGTGIDRTYKLKCSHVFHEVCLVELIATRYHSKCPYCQVSLHRETKKDLYLPNLRREDIRTTIAAARSDPMYIDSAAPPFPPDVYRLQPRVADLVGFDLVPEFTVIRRDTAHEPTALPDPDELDFSGGFEFVEVEERRVATVCLRFLTGLIFGEGSRFRDRFLVGGSVLSQAHLFALGGSHVPRTPQDIDLLYRDETDPVINSPDEWGKRTFNVEFKQRFRKTVFDLAQAVLQSSTEDMDVFAVTIRRTWDQYEAPSCKVIMHACALGGEPVAFPIDIGSGEPFLGTPVTINLPTRILRLDEPFEETNEHVPVCVVRAPKEADNLIPVPAVPLETLIAWRAHSCMERNKPWRPKDLYDLALLLPHVSTATIAPHVRLAYESRGDVLGNLSPLVEGDFGSYAMPNAVVFEQLIEAYDLSTALEFEDACEVVKDKLGPLVNWDGTIPFEAEVEE